MIICFILAVIACFLGDDKRANRAKANQIKNNVLDLVISGGETLFSFVSTARTQSLEIADDVMDDVDD